MVQDVGDGEIILEGAADQDHGGKQHRREHGDAGAASRLPQAERTGTWAEEGEQACQKRIGAQRQGEQERKAADLWHGKPLRIFSETGFESNWKPRPNCPVLSRLRRQCAAKKNLENSA